MTKGRAARKDTEERAERKHYWTGPEDAERNNSEGKDTKIGCTERGRRGGRR